MRFIRHLVTCLSRVWSRSIRRQLAWTFSLTALLVILGAGFLLFSWQRNFLYNQGIKSAFDLAKTLSFSSASWVLADDVVGLQEVLRGSSATTDLKFAVILSPSGEVLASTKEEYINQIFDDAISQHLLTLPAQPQLLLNQQNLLDVAVPIKASHQTIGWVRVELTRDTVNANLREIALEIFAIALFLVLMITLIAIRLARGLTHGLHRLVKVANNAEQGRPFQRQEIRRNDEIGVLAHHLYRMLDTIEAEKQATLASEARFRKLFKVVPIPLCYLTKEGVIERFNDRFAQIFGYSSDEIPTAEAWFQRAYPDPSYRQWVMETWCEAVKTASCLEHDIVPCEYNVTCKNAEVRIVEISGVTLGDDVLATFIDLTARKQAESVLRKREEQLQLVLEGAHLGFWDWNIVTNEVDRNAIWAEMLGYSENEIQHTTQQWEDFIYPDDREKAWQSIYDTLTGKIPYHEVEYRMLHKDGSLRWILDHASIVQRDAEGKPIRMSGTHINITERKKAEAELKQYQEHLEQLVEERTLQLLKAKEAAEAANIAKSTFIATMSHELRTPLNAIMGFSELLIRDSHTSVSQKETLAIINRSGGYLLSMINAVLDISKIEAGRMELNNQAFDLLKLLQEIGDMMKVEAENKHLTFKADIAANVPQYIHTDAGKLRQVLLNLLENALKFTTEGEIILRSQLLARSMTMEQILEIEVSDSGRGMAEERMDVLCQPFVQLARQDLGLEGSGLGLAISKSLLELMGGELKVSSVLGVGSTFTIELPVTLAYDNEVITEICYQPVDSVAPNQTDWRLLIVDDNADNRLLLETMLTQVGFQVALANNGQEAVDKFLQWQPHLIWMDMRMPVMDGYQATRIIRQTPGGEQVKIIAVTASVFKEQFHNILNAGCDAVIHKPFQAAEVFSALKQYLGVKFIEQHQPMPVSPSHQELNPAVLQRLPLELRQQLHKAASNLDMEETDALIAQIHQLSPEIAQALQKLAQGFQFEQIIQLIEAIAH